ncbi:MAG TPA: ferritin-like domain-containing protein [Acidimicrobiia bacterium]|nr:ferritin-like domain-containing protein [Acidimicrobiia bacterium]
MSADRHEPIEISEHELRSMTADLDDMHHATLPVMKEALAEWSELHHQLRAGVARVAPSRRGFLLGAGVALGGLALAACGSSSKSGSSGAANPTIPTSRSTGGAKLTGDLAVVALAAGLENLAVQTYAGGIRAATAGKLGTVPPAVVTFAQTVKSHHEQHAQAWNAVLAGAGKPAVTGVDKTVKDAVVDPAFAKVTDAVGLAGLALVLENVAAATYLEAISVVSAPAGVKTAATIEPVELQHAAILNFVLGKYPVPDTFTKMDGARPLTDVIA